MAERSIIAQIRVEPIGGDASMAEQVEQAVKAMRECGVRVVPGPSATTIEADSLDQIFDAVRAAHEAAIQDVPRLLTTLTIDERRGKDETIAGRDRFVQGLHQ